MRTLFQTIKQQVLEGNDLVLASITASSGSTPRGAGSRMLIGGAVELQALSAAALSSIVLNLWLRIFLRKKNPANMNSD